MVVLALFLTGLAQKEILPRMRARAEKAMAQHVRKPEPAPQEETALIDSVGPAPVDSLEALRTQMETQRRFLESQKDEMARLRGGVDSLLALHEQVQGKELARQAKLLAGMRAEEAAKILEAMDDATLSALLQAMNARAAAKVLARLDAGRAAQLAMVAIGAGETETYLSGEGSSLPQETTEP